jgi:signal transduction histidine kinase
MFRPLKPQHLTLDVIIAAIAFLARGAIGYHEPAMIVVALGMAATYAVHRLSPLLSLIIAWATVVIQLAFVLPPDLSNAAILVMLFGTAAYGSPVVKWLGLASAGLGALVATTYFVIGGSITETTAPEIYTQVLGNLPRMASLFAVGFFASAALFVLSWTLGLLYKTLLESRSRGLAAQSARAERAAAERDVAIEQERNRIARDMHDVVAHSLAVVIAQADGARYAMKSDASAADQALGTISTTAREALSDVRILLGQLRHNQTGGPQPVLADLERLFEQLRSSGLAVRRTDHGTPGTLGTGQQLAVYRIVQESLTNALRHGADPKEALVRFDWTDTALELEVSNTFAADTQSDGHGVDGMRERAVLAGGTLTAEPRGDVFVVAATIPVIV